MKFKDFLLEQKEKHAVMTYMRANPVTSGHQLVVNKVLDLAKKHNASAHVILSHSQDPKKNPLSSEQKLKYAKRAFPGVHVSASDKESPNFLSQAAKLYKQGVTYLHMVGGQDRVDEYHKLLHKYNGVKSSHGYFNFEHIEVHSAGERDPDAEGVEGISASKMREAAAKSDFKTFKKGAPSKMSIDYVKDMYNDVRKGMNIRESINEEFEELLVEGVHDQGIFKAVFLAGGPGSGKDYVLSNTLDGHGLTEINSDKALEFLMDKKGLDKRMPENEKEARDIVRGKAKNITELRQRLALQGRNGLIINGTGDDTEKVKKIKSKLEELGYDTSMILVNTNDEVSTQRNIERGQRGGRTVPETIRKEKWDNVQNARTEYAKIFADRYMEFDNSEDLREAPPEVVKQKKMEMMQLFKNVKEFVAQPPQSPAAQEWVANELQQKDTLEPPKDGVEKVAPHGSKAAEEARKMGLQYYGFGRYGKNGKTLYRSVHDKLVQVTNKEPDQPKLPTPGSSVRKESIDTYFEEFISEDLRKWFDPNHPEGGWKRINSKGEAIGPCAREPGEPKPKCMSNEKRAQLSKKERAAAVSAKRKHDPVADRGGKGGKPVNVSNFGKGKLSETVTVSITGDTVDEVKDFFNTFNNNEVTYGESYALSDSKSDAITLGKFMQPFGERMENTTITNDMVQDMLDESQHNLLKDKQGRVRVFMLRSAAAKEAHTKQGTVLKHKNGYVIKLKEEIEDVKSFKGTIRNWIEESKQTRVGRSIDSAKPGLLSESRTILNTSRTTSSGTDSSGKTEERKKGASIQTSIQETSIQETSAKETRTKITLSEIRQRQKTWSEEQINEIDRGIEPGVSMAGAGESIGRDMGEKIKKKSHKVTTVEMTGDETTTSIGDQKEGELKRKGINLITFKSKRPIG